MYHKKRNFDLWPIKIKNGPIHAYCINMYGKIHQNEKGQFNFSFCVSTIEKTIDPDEMTHPGADLG